MKRLLYLAFGLCIFSLPIQGQSIAKSLGIYIFPANDQDPKTQDADEYACYQWAVEQSGVDPINPPEVEAQATPKGADGSAVQGAAKGALVGAAIGAISGDAGKGAAIGATTGGVGGLAGRRRRQAGQAQQAQNQASQQEAALMDSFKKAFSVCMEGKGYTVNY